MKTIGLIISFLITINMFIFLVTIPAGLPSTQFNLLSNGEQWKYVIHLTLAAMLIAIYSWYVGEIFYTWFKNRIK